MAGTGCLHLTRAHLGSFLWIKIGVNEMDPATLVAYRISIGAVGVVSLRYDQVVSLVTRRGSRG